MPFPRRRCRLSSPRSVSATETTVDEQLAWEARWRGRAAAAAVAAGLLTLGAQIATNIALKDLPRVTIVEGLRNALEHGAQTTVGLKAGQVVFLSDHAATLIAAAVGTALGVAALGFVLVFLYQATKFRRPETPGPARLLAALGAGLAAVGGLVQQIVLEVKAHDFAGSADHSRDAVKDVLESTWVLGPATLQFLGAAILGVGVIIITLNAMRAGLLTRFMGVLGMIVGGLTIFPRISPLPVVPAFWMVALGVLIAGRWPNGMPPAWPAGEAIPWPSTQQLREAGAGRAKEPAPAAQDEGDEEAAEEVVAGRQHSASKKRKRKRRS
jgi:hypothetical protein